MIGSDLGTGGAPPVGLATSWPSAAATAGIHGQAAAATEAFQAKRHRYINLGVVAIMIAGVAFDWIRARRRRTKP